MRGLLQSALVGVAAATLFAPAPAQAWTALNYCGSTPTAWGSGNPETTWRLTSTFQPGDMTTTVAGPILAAAMNEWAVPGCTSFNATWGSTASGDPTDSNNSNHLVGFYTSGWPAAYGSTTLAVTLPWWWSDCEIGGADMVFNDAGYEFINGAPNWYDEADMQSVGAHEFGHWGGFDHNSYSGSTLTAYYSGGTGERTLTCDDTEGICQLYQSRSAYPSLPQATEPLNVKSPPEDGWK